MTSPGARRDRKLIYLATGARAFGNGLLGVLLGIYLAKLGLPMTQVGAILSINLTVITMYANPSTHENFQYSVINQ